MPALKKSAARFLAVLAASASLAPAVCAAAQVKVNDEAPLDLQSPPGFTYVTQGGTGTLSVATTGFMMCTNVVDAGQQPLTTVGMTPQHGTWRFPSVVDLLGVGYRTGTLAIGRNATGMVSSTLTCHTAGAQGEVMSPVSDGILRDSFETKTFEQYTSLVNWVPAQGFNWNAPDWTQVPADPCSPTIDQPARVTEDVTCGAVVGATPAAAGGAQRAAKLWTATDGPNFVYAVRIDARWGTDAIQGVNSVLPTVGRQPESGSSVEYKFVEAYNRGVVGVGGGYLGDTGQWCLLADIPSALSGSTCSGAPMGGALNGPFVSSYENNFTITVGAPPASQPRLSFYMVFIRPIVGAQPPFGDPVVALSVLIDPAVGSVGGDRFKGDDVAFGFLPTSPGFPWMYGQ